MQALLLVDIQNDFCPGGRLAVKDGDQTVAVANYYLKKNLHAIASQDWHPPDHLSFASSHPGKKAGDIIKLNGINQMLWPDHCVQNTSGAEFHHKLDVNKINYIQKKGIHKTLDSYSAFFENDHKTTTKLDKYIKEKGIDQLLVMGLATEYCVKYTVLDALKLNLKVTLIHKGCRAININRDDEKTAIAQMQAAGAEIL